MIVRSVVLNRRKRCLDVRVGARHYTYPCSRLTGPPSDGDRIAEVFVDPEIAREGFTVRWDSGHEETVHAELVLDYNRDPGLLREQVLYALTLEARCRLADSGLARREVIRRLRTSPAQLYRLLDPTRTRKSVDQLLRLLSVLDCAVTVAVHGRAGRTRGGGPVDVTLQG